MVLVRGDRADRDGRRDAQGMGSRWTRIGIVAVGARVNYSTGRRTAPLLQGHRVMADTSQSLATEREARDVAESARETEWEHPSFVRELFLGRFRFDLIHPHPPEDAAEVARAKPF